MIFDEVSVVSQFIFRSPAMPPPTDTARACMICTSRVHAVKQAIDVGVDSGGEMMPFGRGHGSSTTAKVG
jgi:hypothetical protein